MLASKKNDDVYSSAGVECGAASVNTICLGGNGGNGSHVSSVGRQRVFFRVIFGLGVVAVLSVTAGLLLLAREFETGNDVANRLNILVPKAVAEEVHDAFQRVKVRRRLRGREEVTCVGDAAQPDSAKRR